MLHKYNIKHSVGFLFLFNSWEWTVVVLVVMVWEVDLQLLIESIPITTNFASSDPTQARCTQYNINRYLKKFVSDVRQVSGFLSVLQFPQPRKLPATI